MKIRAALVAMGMMLIASLCTPAVADDATRNQRMISPEVCLQRPATMKGWHLAEAAEAWSATGVVDIRLSQSCVGAPAKIVVRTTWHAAYRAGDTWWPAHSYMYGGRLSETDPTQWLYPVAAVRLNASHLRWMGKNDRRCYGWFLAAHEIGHALGLWHVTGRDQVMSNDFDFRSNCWQLDPVDVSRLQALGYPSA